MNVQTVEIKPTDWARLWSPLTRSDLNRLIAVIKDKSLTLDEARQRAKAMKNLPPFTEAIMQVNPKIDGSQRRLQCSVRFDDFFKHLPKQPTAPDKRVRLFSACPFPRPFDSASRKIAP